MKLAEKILAAIALVGITLSLINIPGGSVLTILSLCALSLFYFYLGFAFFNNISNKDLLKRSSYKEVSVKRIIGAVAAGMTMSMIVTALLFKIMMWPGSSFMILTGLVPAVVITIISIIKYPANKTYYRAILTRTIVAGSLGLLLFLLPPNTIMKVKYRCCPDYVRAVEAAAKNPEDIELRRKVDEEQRKMSEQE